MISLGNVQGLLVRGSRSSLVRLAQIAIILFAAFAPTGLRANTFGDPRGFLSNQQITETFVYAGVKYIRADGSHEGRPMVTHIATVDLSYPNIKLQMLPGERQVSATSGQFFRRSRVSHMQQDNNALIAINSAFFDISSTMAPHGLHIRDGMILREPASSRASFAVTENGLAFIQNFTWSRTIRYGAGTHVLHGVNAHTIGDNNVALYQYPWDRSPGKDAALVNGRGITEVVFENVSFTKSQSRTQRHVLRGKVLQVRNDAASVGLNSANFVLTATGTARAFLQQMTAGSTVDIDWLLGGLPATIDWNRISEVVSGNNLLLINGVSVTGSGSHWDTRHPRSAIGIDQSQKKVLFLLVEGRQSGRADGMSLDSVRDYMRHLGVYNSVEFDGGGSSALAGRINGANLLLSTPSDGSERYVPTGLGVVPVVEPPHPFFQNIRVSTGHNTAAITWQTPQPARSHVLFGKEGYDIASIRNYETSTNHTVYLSGLEPLSVYYFRMVAETAATNHTSQGLELTSGVEVIVDDPQATLVGSWNTGAFEAPFGPSYRWTETITGNSATGTATFRPNLPITGSYDLHVWYTPGGNRTTAARYEIKNQTTTSVLTQSQRTGGNSWTLLASNMAFQQGTNGHARVRNDSTGGTVVIADAFRWVLRNPAPLPVGEVPEWWRAHFFGSNPVPAHVDSDGDGYSLFEEYVWGTVPNDGKSQPQMRFEQPGGEVLRIIFSSYRSDRVYRIETGTNLASWTNISFSAQEDNGKAIVDLPVVLGAEKRFYRVRVLLP